MENRVEARQWPVGTLRELREANLDLKANAACSPGGKGSPVRGCPVWEDCRFHLKRQGGFKGRGPHNVGYFEKIDNAVKEDWCPCYLWTRNLQPLADQNIPGHVYAIVAQEGEDITFVRTYAVDGLDSNRTKNYATAREKVVMPVPKFPRPAERFADEVIARQLEAQRREDLARDHLSRSGMGPGAEVSEESIAAMREAQEELLRIQATHGSAIPPVSAADAERVADTVAEEPIDL